MVMDVHQHVLSKLDFNALEEPIRTLIHALKYVEMVETISAMVAKTEIL